MIWREALTRFARDWATVKRKSNLHTFCAQSQMKSVPPHKQDEKHFSSLLRIQFPFVTKTTNTHQRFSPRKFPYRSAVPTVMGRKLASPDRIVMEFSRAIPNFLKKIVLNIIFVVRQTTIPTRSKTWICWLSRSVPKILFTHQYVPCAFFVISLLAELFTTWDSPRQLVSGKF